VGLHIDTTVHFSNAAHRSSLVSTLLITGDILLLALAAVK